MEKHNVFPNEERRPYSAGSFYPGDPLDLTKTISRLYYEAEKKHIDGDVFSLVSPHAGYVYSGAVAAAGFKLLEGLKYELVVVIAPSHAAMFPGASIYNGGAYVTPLDKLYTDLDLAIKMANINPSKVYLSTKGHTGGAAGRAEHALEVQLPFLQVVLGDFKLIPIVMGDQEKDTCIALAEILVGTLQDRNALIVASSDLSHYHSADEAEVLDNVVLSHVQGFDPNGLYSAISRGHCEACGFGPTVTAMLASRRLGADRSDIVKYAHSGEVSGDNDAVVGYMSAVQYKSRPVKTYTID
jgi:AmmeMemoRadiSam system protein B